MQTFYNINNFKIQRVLHSLIGHGFVDTDTVTWFNTGFIFV